MNGKARRVLLLAEVKEGGQQGSGRWPCRYLLRYAKGEQLGGLSSGRTACTSRDLRVGQGGVAARAEGGMGRYPAGTRRPLIRQGRHNGTTCGVCCPSSPCQCLPLCISCVVIRVFIFWFALTRRHVGWPPPVVAALANLV